jgi:predicted amidohydrolase YtcJ
VAVNRVAPGKQAEPFLPDQRLTLAEALAAYTAGTARVNHADQTGRVVAGMLADLVMLDRNPFDGPQREIHETRVAATFVSGKPVYLALPTSRNATQLHPPRNVR